MREIRAKGLLQVVPKEVKEIFDLIEGTFDPLGKCKVRCGTRSHGSGKHTRGLSMTMLIVPLAV